MNTFFYPRATHVEVAEDFGKTPKGSTACFCYIEKSGKISHEVSRRTGYGLFQSQGINPESI